MNSILSLEKKFNLSNPVYLMLAQQLKGELEILATTKKDKLKLAYLKKTRL